MFRLISVTASDGEGDGMGGVPQPFSLSQVVQDMVSNLTSAVGAPLPTGEAAAAGYPLQGMPAAGAAPRGAAPPPPPPIYPGTFPTGIPGVPAGRMMFIFTGTFL